MKSVLFVAAAVCLLGYVFGAEDAEESPKERFVALYRTATYITVSTSTVERFYSCITTSSAAACTGRRRRKRKLDIAAKVVPEVAAERMDQLQGSLSEPAPEATGTAEGKLGFTVWTTSTSSLTLFTTSLNSATTVIVTYLCTHANQSIVPACG